MEMLIPFLDGSSTLALVTTLPLALQVIQRKSVCVKHVKRLCPFHINTVVSDEEKTNDNDVEKSKKAPKAHFVKMLPNLELGMTFLLAYEKIRKEMKEIEERGELQQHQVPEDSLPKVNKTKSERHKFVRLPYPSSVRMMY